MRWSQIPDTVVVSGTSNIPDDESQGFGNIKINIDVDVNVHGDCSHEL